MQQDPENNGSGAMADGVYQDWCVDTEAIGHAVPLTIPEVPGQGRVPPAILSPLI
jgi:hypothetical protein